MGGENIKLKIISDMIRSSMVNNGLEQMEYDFICCIGEQLGLAQYVIDGYIEDNEIFILPGSIQSKILKFYKTALHDKNLCKNYYKWIRNSYRQGMAMGLPQKVIRKFLYDLHFCDDFSKGERIIKNYFALEK
ncbi:hypothetical protein SAMN05192545_2258 [Maribacter dokdonensis]|uniref:Uncharacterized protein n=1 Tax=Maribacter dokdonensis TaxID=320912 RepID=A0ABY0ULP6_9FLAO|nr:hypothetical protein [Maribacter dokdonensis]SDS87881.1 hypothetical protein SAMN05192545_2258 [Maribacter dokdonensis]